MSGDEGHQLSQQGQGVELPPAPAPARHSVIPRHRRPRGGAQPSPLGAPYTAPTSDIPADIPAVHSPSVGENPFSVLAADASASAGVAASVPQFGGAPATAEPAPHPSPATAPVPTNVAPRLSDEDVSRIATMVANLLSGNASNK